MFVDKRATCTIILDKSEQIYIYIYIYYIDLKRSNEEYFKHIGIMRNPAITNFY